MYRLWFNGGHEVVVLVDGFGYVCKGLFFSDFVRSFVGVFAKCGDVLNPL